MGHLSPLSASNFGFLKIKISTHQCTPETLPYLVVYIGMKRYRGLTSGLCYLTYMYLVVYVGMKRYLTSGLRYLTCIYLAVYVVMKDI